MLVAVSAGGRHVSIMITWHQAHIGWPAERVEPPAGMHELGRKRDVDEIARDCHVGRLLTVKIARYGIKRFAAVDAMTAASPIDVAEEPLRREFPHARPRQRPEVRIGQVREHEWFAHGCPASTMSCTIMPFAATWMPRRS
jgi:hypothetical protein